mmetsp:Transcript_222/g.497  ORF Transcript_222/g.497 Transcript_222/m.497 type:complete len:210 (-) Transcript_222:352-981(-)
MHHRLGPSERLRHFRATANGEPSASVDHNRTACFARYDVDLHTGRPPGCRRRQHHRVDSVLNAVARKATRQHRSDRQRPHLVRTNDRCITFAGDSVKQMAVRRTEALGKPMVYNSDTSVTGVRPETNGDSVLFNCRHCHRDLVDRRTSVWNVLKMSGTAELRHALLPQRVYVRQYDYVSLQYHPISGPPVFGLHRSALLSLVCSRGSHL